MSILYQGFVANEGQFSPTVCFRRTKPHQVLVLESSGGKIGLVEVGGTVSWMKGRPVSYDSAEFCEMGLLEVHVPILLLRYPNPATLRRRLRTQATHLIKFAEKNGLPMDGFLYLVTLYERPCDPSPSKETTYGITYSAKELILNLPAHRVEVGVIGSSEADVIPRPTRFERSPVI